MIWYRLPVHGIPAQSRTPNFGAYAIVTDPEPPPPPEGLTQIAYWTLDDNTWVDGVGGHTLQQVGSIAVVTGAVNNCAQFNTNSAFLRSFSSDLAGDDRHWRFEAKINYSTLATISNRRCFEWVGDWFLLIEYDFDSGQIDFLASLENGYSTGGSSTQITSGQYDRGVWHDVAVEMNPDTRVFSLSVNGDVTSAYYGDTTFRDPDQAEVASAGDGSIYWKIGQIQRLKMDEVKFYKD